ncbi:MAG: hypothetical protein QM499_11550 [Flavobacteriaceae bacterium]
MKLINFAITLSIFLSLFSNKIAAQDNKINGEWILEHIIQDNESKPIYQILKFEASGALLIRDAPFGTWTCDLKNNTLTIDSKKIGGIYQITALEEQEMELFLDNKSLYFTKIDRTKIITDNKNSSLIGVWKFQSQEHLQELVEFKEPDDLFHIEMDDSYKGKHSGMWLYKPNTKELIIIGQIGNISGLNTVLSISNNEVLLQNKGNEYILKKETQITIERLDFHEEEFQYEDEEGLPWKDYYKMLEANSKINQLVYQYDMLEENTSTFETKLLTANISVSINDEKISIDNIFSGYDRSTLYEDQEFPENVYSTFKPLYPCTADTYRVVGEEEVIVPAGTFQCTVVEAFGSFGTLFKVYMIKDKPGIIAKLISDNPDEFGHYAIYQLKEIQLN